MNPPTPSSAMPASVATAIELEKIVRDLVGAVATEGNTRVVFGAPVALEKHKIIPVATVQIGFGGGVGSARTSRPGVVSRFGQVVGKLFQAGFGGGGGGGIKVTPVGFICERGDNVHFEPIATNGHPTQGLH
jgi:uncharacterized spore protein YtfJ